jgi:hypothetical protein
VPFLGDKIHAVTYINKKIFSNPNIADTIGTVYIKSDDKMGSNYVCLVEISERREAKND